jgi:hypothetical protein
MLCHMSQVLARLEWCMLLDTSRLDRSECLAWVLLRMDGGMVCILPAHTDSGHRGQQWGVTPMPKCDLGGVAQREVSAAGQTSSCWQGMYIHTVLGVCRARLLLPRVKLMDSQLAHACMHACGIWVLLLPPAINSCCYSPPLPNTLSSIPLPHTPPPPPPKNKQVCRQVHPQGV